MNKLKQYMNHKLLFTLHTIYKKNDVSITMRYVSVLKSNNRRGAKTTNENNNLHLQ